MTQARPILALFLLASVADGQPPRYRLNPGDRLIYERRSEQTDTLRNERRRQVEQIQIYCLDRELDAALLLVELGRVVEGDVVDLRGFSVTIDPRGIATCRPEMSMSFEDCYDVLDLLPVLPAALDRREAWTAPTDTCGLTWEHRAAPEHGADCFRYTLRGEDELLAHLDVEQTGTYCFDREACIVTRAETTRRNGSKQRVIVTRFHEKRREATPWCTARLGELDRYLRAQRLEATNLDEMLTTPQRTSHLSRIERTWQEFLDARPHDEASPVRGLARARLARLPRDMPRLRERDELAREWLARPAAHWSLQTPAGETIRSEDVRDRCTVEFFWSADSASSLRSFRTLRGLRESLPEEQLRIVCLNLDTNLVRAAAAAETFGAGFLHVFSGPPIRGEAPVDLPILRILDREGRVQKIMVGHQDSFLPAVKPYAR